MQQKLESQRSISQSPTKQKKKNKLLDHLGQSFDQRDYDELLERDAQDEILIYELLRICQIDLKTRSQEEIIFLSKSILKFESFQQFEGKFGLNSLCYLAQKLQWRLFGSKELIQRQDEEFSQVYFIIQGSCIKEHNDKNPILKYSEQISQGDNIGLWDIISKNYISQYAYYGPQDKYVQCLFIQKEELEYILRLEANKSEQIQNFNLDVKYNWFLREKYDYFSGLPILNFLSDNEKIQISYDAEKRNFSKFQKIFEEGEECKEVFFIKTGEIKLFQSTLLDGEQDELENLKFFTNKFVPQLKNQIDICLLGENQMFGHEEAIFNCEWRRISAICKSIKSVCYVLETKNFLKIFRHYFRNKDFQELLNFSHFTMQNREDLIQNQQSLTHFIVNEIKKDIHDYSSYKKNKNVLKYATKNHLQYKSPQKKEDQNENEEIKNKQKKNQLEVQVNFSEENLLEQNGKKDLSNSSAIINQNFKKQKENAQIGIKKNYFEIQKKVNNLNEQENIYEIQENRSKSPTKNLTQMQKQKQIYQAQEQKQRKQIQVQNFSNFLMGDEENPKSQCFILPQIRERTQSTQISQIQQKQQLNQNNQKNFYNFVTPTYKSNYAQNSIQKDKSVQFLNEEEKSINYTMMDDISGNQSYLTGQNQNLLENFRSKRSITIKKSEQNLVVQTENGIQIKFPEKYEFGSQLEKLRNMKVEALRNFLVQKEEARLRIKRKNNDSNEQNLEKSKYVYEKKLLKKYMEDKYKSISRPSNFEKQIDNFQNLLQKRESVFHIKEQRENLFKIRFKNQYKNCKKILSQKNSLLIQQKSQPIY